MSAVWRSGLVRHPVAMAGVTALLVLVAHLAGTHATAWHFFHDAARLLLGDNGIGGATGLSLYRDHPEFQFGPPGILMAVPLSGFGLEVGSVMAMVLSSVLGVIVVRLVIDLIESLRPIDAGTTSERATLVAVVLIVITWGDVAARTAHIDDALALASLIAAMVAIAARQPTGTIIWLALAAAAKPWAIMLAPLAAVHATIGWSRAWRVGAVGALALAVWAPFLIAEPSTWDTRGFAIDNDPTSVLRALGFDDALTPSWVRPVQLGGGLVLAAVLVMAGRWPAVMLAVLSWRLVVEPGAHRYYTIGVVLGALVVELLRRPNRVPVASIAVAVSLEVTALPGMDPDLGRWWRAFVVIAALGAALTSRVGSASPTRGEDEAMPAVREERAGRRRRSTATTRDRGS